MFQSDIYPPTFAGVPALSAEEWAGGANKDPILIAFTAKGLEELSPKDAPQVGYLSGF